MNQENPTRLLRSLSARLALFAIMALALSGISQAQTVESRSLTDKLHRGSGVIDLLRNISGSELNSYFNETGKLLLLGVDVNENNSDNESSSSLGAAIKNAQLSISTTDGDFTFTDFFTSTSSMLRETGSNTAAAHNTLFGQAGSSQITGTGSFDISNFDDVMWFENINFTGDITSATLTVNLLDTGRNNTASNGSEKFFDFTGGFEDFALLSAADAILLENANIGMANAPADVVFASTGRTAVDAIAEATGGGGGGGTGGGGGGGDTGGGTGTGGGGGDVVTPPAAPMPPFLAVVLMAALMLWKQRKFLRLQNA